MRKGFLVFSLLGLVGLQIGCTTLTGSDLLSSKSNGTKTVTTSQQFDEMAGNSENYVGQDTKLAGAVVSIDQTAEGYLVLARWLPYPKQEDQAPKVGQAEDSRHFLIRFVGKREKTFHTNHGNKFLLEGTVAGTKKALVNVFGRKQNLLYVNTTCIKIWENGHDADSSSQIDSEYPPTRKRTLCAD